jgi:hypothetical protein
MSTHLTVKGMDLMRKAMGRYGEIVTIEGETKTKPAPWSGLRRFAEMGAPRRRRSQTRLWRWVIRWVFPRWYEAERVLEALAGGLPEWDPWETSIFTKREMDKLIDGALESVILGSLKPESPILIPPVGTVHWSLAAM